MKVCPPGHQGRLQDDEPSFRWEWVGSRLVRVAFDEGTAFDVDGWHFDYSKGKEASRLPSGDWQRGGVGMNLSSLNNKREMDRDKRCRQIKRKRPFKKAPWRNSNLLCVLYILVMYGLVRHLSTLFVSILQMQMFLFLFR